MFILSSFLDVFMCTSVLAACMNIHMCELDALEGQKRESDLLELESGGCELM